MSSVFLDKIKIIKQEHIYSSDEKLKWFGYGEWIEELDSLVFEYNLYKCLVHRIVKKEPCSAEEHYFGGHLCGYVEIPFAHPLFGIDLNKIDIECHGGLNYSECHGEHQLIGFDCAHSCDYTPSMEKFRKESWINEIFPIPEEYKEFAIFNPVYRNIDFVINECMQIVDQLIAKEKT